jgi:GAF domain-containing protein
MYVMKGKTQEDDMTQERKGTSVANDPAQEEASYIQTVLYIILATALLVSGVAAIVAFTAHYQVASRVPVISFAVSLFLLGLTWRRHLTLPRLVTPLLSFCVAVFLVWTGDGLRDEAMFLYPLTLVLAGLVSGKRSLMVYTALSLIAITVQGYGEVSGLVVTRFSNQTLIQSVIILDLFLAFMGTLLYTAINNLSNSLVRARRNERQMAETNLELEAIRTSLEAHVQERTRELERRAGYLETTATVAHDAASILNLQEMLDRVAVLISDRFGFYHTGIYLTDAAGEWAELQAASGAGGKRLLARRHRVPMSGKGIVPNAIGHGEPRIALDVGADAVFFNNHDLADTRSEAALPLRARGQTIGALDVHSDQRRAFEQEDITALQILADEVGLAISNARLFQQAQESLEAERRAYGQLSGEAWDEMLRMNPNLGYFYSQGALSRLENRPAGPYSALGQVKNGNGDTLPPQPQELPELKLRVQARGNVIGTISAHKPDQAGTWTPEEIALLETLTEQLGTALESARLYQDTQRRATREKLIGEVTARMRETLDVEAVLKTAVNEMRQALGLEKVLVRLAPHLESASGNVSPAKNGDKVEL